MELSSELVEVSSWIHCKNYRFHYYLFLMEFGKFMDFIHFSLLIISVNFLDRLVTDICDPVLKD